MKTMFILGSAALLSLGAAAPASAQSASHILRGAGIGAAGGVIAGAVIPETRLQTNACLRASSEKHLSLRP